MKQLYVAALIAVLLGIFLMLMSAGQADAKVVAGNHQGCSLPYVTEVHDGVATIEVLGKPAALKVKGGKADRVGNNTWMMRVKRNRTYVFCAIDKLGNKHIISYKIRRW